MHFLTMIKMCTFTCTQDVIYVITFYFMVTPHDNFKSH